MGTLWNDVSEGLQGYDVVVMRYCDGGGGEGALLDRGVQDGEGLAEDFILIFEGCDEWRGGSQDGFSREKSGNLCGL